jgi:ABC-2 type transport system permease protein
MRAYWKLTQAQLVLFARNRTVIFFSLVFPILLMMALGTFLGGGGDVRLKGVVIDQDGTVDSREAVAKLTALRSAGLTVASDETQARDALKRGDLKLVVMIPKSFEEQLRIGKAKVHVLYDEKSQTVSQIGVQLIEGVVDALSKERTGYAPVVGVEASPVQSLGLKYIDFLVPGIVAMMIMSSNLNGVAGQIASWRERGVLRRMQSTTLRARTFIAAQITARLILNGSQALIVLLLGAFAFGTRVSGSWALVVMYVILGTLVFMSIGFIIAGLAKTPESAGPIAGFVSFPLLFLGNVFFPISSMPELLQPVVKALPITHLAHAMREVMNVGATLGDLWLDTVWLIGWLIVAFVIASMTFKWE